LGAYQSAGVSALSPDGRTLAVKREGVIQLWELPARKIIARLEGLPADELAFMAFSPDGGTLAATSSGRYIEGEKYEASLVFWDVKSGKKKDERAFGVAFPGTHTFGFSRDGKRLALEFTLSRKNNVSVLALKTIDVQSGKETPLAKAQSYLWPTFSPDDKRLIVNHGAETLFLDA